MAKASGPRQRHHETEGHCQVAKEQRSKQEREAEGTLRVFERRGVSLVDDVIRRLCKQVIQREQRQEEAQPLLDSAWAVG